MKILIISDIHANLAALEAVLETEGSWDEVYCLGDTVVAGPNPNEVLDVLRQLNGIFILGNHDMDVIRDLNVRHPKGIARRLITTVKQYGRNAKAFFRPHQDPSPDRIWYAWTCRQITEQNRRFMASFVETATVQRGVSKIRLIHGIVPREWGYGTRIWPDSPDALFVQLAACYPEDTIVFGNAHVQFRKAVAGKTFICVGGLGQPRLGKPLAAYVVLTERGLALRSVPYNTEATAQAMDRIGLEDKAFVEKWKQCYRTAVLPPHYKIRREWESLKDDYV